MAVIPKFGALVLVGALAGCSVPAPPGVTTSSTTRRPSARVGLGGVSSAAPVSVVDEANFQSPSKNITCALTLSSVRCDIVHKSWEPPPRPSACGLGWGHGIHLDHGKADFVCAGDTVVGTATLVLPYGASLRAGNVQCDSGSDALRCVDTHSQHGFTLAAADYDLF